MTTKQQAIEWLMRPKTVNDLAEMIEHFSVETDKGANVEFSIPNGPDLTEMVGVLTWLIENKS